MRALNVDGKLATPLEAVKRRCRCDYKYPSIAKLAVEYEAIET